MHFFCNDAGKEGQYCTSETKETPTTMDTDGRVTIIKPVIARQKKRDCGST
jgi:hypothetical protein